MDRDDGSDTQARFGAYVADLASVLGHADRVRPFGDYRIGLRRQRAARTSNRWRL